MELLHLLKKIVELLFFILCQCFFNIALQETQRTGVGTTDFLENCLVGVAFKSFIYLLIYKSLTYFLGSHPYSDNCIGLVDDGIPINPIGGISDKVHYLGEPC